MIRNEFRMLGVIVGDVVDVDDKRFKFFLEVDSRKSGRTTTYPIIVNKDYNRRISKERVVASIGKVIWLVGYVENFDNHLSLISQNFMECKWERH
jgi:hypothetical protein